MLVHRHAVAAKFRAEVVKQPPLARNQPVRRERKGVDSHGAAIAWLHAWHPVAAVVGLGNIQRPAVGAQCEPIGLGDVVSDLDHIATWRDAVDGPPPQLPRLVPHVARICEVQIARIVGGDVVGRVEALASEIVDDQGALLGLNVPARDTPAAVVSTFGGVQVAIGTERQAIGLVAIGSEGFDHLGDRIEPVDPTVVLATQDVREIDRPIRRDCGALRQTTRLGLGACVQQFESSARIDDRLTRWSRRVFSGISRYAKCRKNE